MILAVGICRPFVAAVAAITHVVIHSGGPNPDVQAPARDMSFLVFTIEAPIGAGIRAGLIAAITNTVTIVVIEMVERYLFAAIQTLEVALVIGLVCVVVEETYAPANGRRGHN